MKNHVWRPLLATIVLLAVILAVRHIAVPDDFGVNGRNFTYGFFRLGSIDDWKAFKVKYLGKNYCEECHTERFEENQSSPHIMIECENCHGPAVDHPDEPEALVIDRSRALCLRCHTELPYPGSYRSEIPGIDPEEHNSDMECSECHNPHNPDLEQME